MNSLKNPTSNWWVIFIRKAAAKQQWRGWKSMLFMCKWTFRILGDVKYGFEVLWTWDLFRDYVYLPLLHNKPFTKCNGFKQWFIISHNSLVWLAFLCDWTASARAALSKVPSTHCPGPQLGCLEWLGLGHCLHMLFSSSRCLDHGFSHESPRIPSVREGKHWCALEL